MRKVWAVAWREYKSAVQTKAFIASIVMMPMLMGISVGVQLWIKKSEDSGTKKYAVVDRTGQLRSALEAAIVRHNDRRRPDSLSDKKYAARRVGSRAP